MKLPSFFNRIRRTPGDEAMAGPEGLQGNGRKPERPLTSGSTQFGDLAPLAHDRRPPGDLPATEARRRSPLPAPAGAAAPPGSSSSTPVDLTTAGHEPVDASAELHLPLEIREKIAGALCGPDMFQTFSNLHALSMTSTGFRSAIKEDMQLRYDELRGKVDAANTLADEILNGNNSGAAPGYAIRHMGPMLPFLTPGNRDRLFEATVAIRDSPHKKREAMKALAAGMACLSERQQRIIALAMSSDVSVKASHGESLMALLPGMAYLSKPNCDLLLKNVSRHIESEHASGDVLARLATVMNHLSEKQRDNLVTTAMSLSTDEQRAKALGGVGAGMVHLPEMQREGVVAAAIEIQNEEHRALALAGLGAGLAHLSDPQREMLVTAAIGIGNEDHMSRALQGLSVGMAHLTEMQREKLVAAAIAMNTRTAFVKEDALSCLCVEAVHLSKSQRTRLSAFAEGITDPWSKTYVRASMAHFSEAHFQSFIASLTTLSEHDWGPMLGQAVSVMASLSEAQRDQLIDAAIGLRDDSCRSIALENLRKGMAYLSELQRDRIVAAITRMDNFSVMLIVEQLHAAAEYWSEAQRGRLMAACAGWTATRAGLLAGMFATPPRGGSQPLTPAGSVA